MKNRFRQLPKYMQWFFTVGEVLLGLFLVIGLGVLVFAGKLLIEGNFAGSEQDGGISVSLDLGTIEFALPEDSYSIVSESIGADSILIEDAVGKIAVKNPTHADEFLRMFSGPLLVVILFGGGMVLAIMECFRRLFRSVRFGESFLPSTVANLHKIGFLIIGLEFGLMLGSAWIRSQITGYLRKDLEVTGIETSFASPGEGVIQVGFGEMETTLGLNVSGVVVGLIILAIGEAFRQGVMLKEEGELTI